MNCALLPEDIQRLRISIKKKLVKLIENKEALDVKEQSKAIYDLIFSKTQDENQALDYARMVPKLINQWASYKTEFTDLVLDSGADAGLLKLSRDVLHEETGLDAMRSYLELDKSNLSEELASAYNNSTSSAEELKEFIRNLQQEFKLEIVLDGNEFTFNTNESSNIKGAAEALVQAGYKSKLASITIPDMSGIVKPALRTYTTVESLKEKGTFRGKKVNFVDIIPTSRETPVALTNRKGEIWIVEKLFREKYNEKAWLNPAQLKDGSIAAALGEDQFKSFEEFLTFALIHEVKHDTMFRTEGEN